MSMSPHLRVVSSASRASPSADPVQTDAMLLLRDIKAFLATADFFQREDLLHLPAFQDVATITRYGRVCDAVNHLLETNRIVAKTRTDLCLPQKAKLYAATPAHEEYEGAVQRIVAGLRGENFGVMDCVAQWKTDPHLTTNSKRVIVRLVLRRLLTRGELAKVNRYEFRVRAPEGRRAHG